MNDNKNSIKNYKNNEMAIEVEDILARYGFQRPLIDFEFDEDLPNEVFFDCPRFNAITENYCLYFGNEEAFDFVSYEETVNDEIHMLVLRGETGGTVVIKDLNDFDCDFYLMSDKDFLNIAVTYIAPPKEANK